jgi:hypothetical protein
MISKEIMKRGGILSRLVQFEEESPYKPDTERVPELVNWTLVAFLMLL